MDGSIAGKSSGRLRHCAIACALAASLSACDFVLDGGESDRLQASLRESVDAVGELSSYAVADRPSPAQPPAAPMTTEILRTITASNIDELERLLGELQAAYERGDLPQSQLWKIFGLFDIVIPGALPALDAWVAQYPKSYAARLARARHLAALGWNARGTEYAHDTPAEKFREMRRLHTLAADDLRASLPLAQRPFLSVETLMTIARGAGARPDVETLFEEGVRSMPKTFPLYRARMWSLEPRWGGSFDAMRALVARAETDGLPAREIAWLRAWVLLEENDGEIRANPRAAVPFAVKATEMDDRAPRWRHRSRVERDHGFLEEALASASRAIALDPDDYESWAERGYVREKRGEMAEALADYERGARLGSYYAQERIIRAHAYGELTAKRDYATAREWCEFAAGMANPWGDFCIGGLYFDGLGGLPKDEAAAFKWFRRAAEKGHATAQHDIGWMLVQGKGVAPNRDEGIEWLRKAARQDHEYAKAKLRQLGVPIEPLPTWQDVIKKVVLGL